MKIAINSKEELLKFFRYNSGFSSKERKLLRRILFISQCIQSVVRSLEMLERAFPNLNLYERYYLKQLLDVQGKLVCPSHTIELNEFPSKLMINVKHIP